RGSHRAVVHQRHAAPGRGPRPPLPAARQPVARHHRHRRRDGQIPRRVLEGLQGLIALQVGRGFIQQVLDPQPRGPCAQVSRIEAGGHGENPCDVDPLALGNLAAHAVPLQLRQQDILGGGNRVLAGLTQEFQSLPCRSPQLQKLERIDGGEDVDLLAGWNVNDIERAASRKGIPDLLAVRVPVAAKGGAQCPGLLRADSSHEVYIHRGSNNSAARRCDGAANEIGYPQALPCGGYEPKSVDQGMFHCHLRRRLSETARGPSSAEPSARTTRAHPRWGSGYACRPPRTSESYLSTRASGAASPTATFCAAGRGTPSTLPATCRRGTYLHDSRRLPQRVYFFFKLRVSGAAACLCVHSPAISVPSLFSVPL